MVKDEDDRKNINKVNFDPICLSIFGTAIFTSVRYFSEIRAANEI